MEGVRAEFRGSALARAHGELVCILLDEARNVVRHLPYRARQVKPSLAKSCRTSPAVAAVQGTLGNVKSEGKPSEAI